MPQLTRNHLAITRAACVNGKRTLYTIQGVKGLELFVLPTGTRTWRVRYQIGKGASRILRRYTIGDANVINFGQATTKAIEVMSAAELDGIDTHAKRKAPKGDTFADIFKRWHEFSKQHKKPKSLTLDVYVYSALIAGTPLDSMPLRDIRRTDVTALLDKIATDKTPLRANSAQTVVSGALSWALGEGLLDAHPSIGIKRRGTPRTITRQFSQAELRAIWHGAAKLPQQQCAAVRLLLLLGQRRSEIVEAERAEVHLSAKTLSIRAPRRKGWRRGKPELPHVVPLPPIALSLVEDALADSPRSQFIFPHEPSKGKAMAATPMRADYLTTAFRELMDGLGLPDVRLHDLRHAVKTGMTG